MCAKEGLRGGFEALQGASQTKFKGASETVRYRALLVISEGH